MKSTEEQGASEDGRQVCFGGNDIADSNKVEANAVDEPLNDLDAYYRQHWNPAERVGAPVGLQLVGKRLEDEKVSP